MLVGGGWGERGVTETRPNVSFTGTVREVEVGMHQERGGDEALAANLPPSDTGYQPGHL